MKESTSGLREIRAPYALFLGDCQSETLAKTGFGLKDWCPDKCAAQIRLNDNVVDLGLPTMSIEEAATAGCRTLVVGIANMGGFVPESWLESLRAALNAGMDLAAGLHQPLADLPGLDALARKLGRTIHDVRQPKVKVPVATGRKRTGKRILTVGTDCAIGKKYTALSLYRELAARGHNVDFRATGQTGVLIAGKGICMDAVVSDFIAGAAEMLSPDAADDHFDVIEGQGSLFHPSYAGVTMGLLHGSQPDFLVLCHEAGRQHIAEMPDFPLPSPDIAIPRYIEVAQLTNPSVRMAGIAINTKNLSEDEARLYLSEVSRRTELPVTDPVRFGAGVLADYIEAHV